MELEWQVETAYASQGKFKRFARKYPREYESVFTNLEKVMRLLRSGNKLGSFQIGFFRSEGDGVYRIGQTAVPGAKESRLYLFPDEQNRVMYVLNIGDKDSQDVDINESKRLATAIKPKPGQ